MKWTLILLTPVILYISAPLFLGEGPALKNKERSYQVPNFLKGELRSLLSQSRHFSQIQVVREVLK